MTLKTYHLLLDQSQGYGIVWTFKISEFKIYFCLFTSFHGQIIGLCVTFHFIFILVMIYQKVKLRENIFIQIIFIFGYAREMYCEKSENSSSSKDQMVQPPDHLALASSLKGIIYNHVDWGKPINYYNNLKKSQVAAQVPHPEPVPKSIPSYLIPQHSDNIQKKLAAMASWYGLDSFQSYQLRKYFFQVF